jgi:hypothetical protein
MPENKGNANPARLRFPHLELQADECTPSCAVMDNVVANNAVIGKRINP